jgi:cytochrome c-type biogenesis protein CcmH
MKHKNWFLLLVIALGGALLLLAGCAAGEQATQTVGNISDDQVNVVARELYCPVCEGIPLDVCDTQACADWREQIRTMLGEGMNKEEIKEYFRQQFGDRVLGVPPNPLVFIVPAVLVALAAGVVVMVVLGSRKPAADKVKLPGTPPENDPYVARMEDELKKRMNVKK